MILGFSFIIVLKILLSDGASLSWIPFFSLFGCSPLFCETYQSLASKEKYVDGKFTEILLVYQHLYCILTVDL